MKQKNDDFIFYNKLLKNWKLNLSDTGLRRFLIFLSEDMKRKSINHMSKVENDLINKICFLEVVIYLFIFIHIIEVL